MLIDRFGHHHTTDSAIAVAAFEEATLAIASHRPVGDSLDRALAADPDHVSSWALRSIGSALLARNETITAASNHASTARTALERTGAVSASERALVEAAQLAAGGKLQLAALVLENHVSRQPRDFLAAKAAHAMRFMTGQPERMLAISTQTLPHWQEGDLGYGFLLGCHAFGLEELGRYKEAEAAGRRAVELEPADAWGRHAVSHVMEMSGRTGEGIAWLNASRPFWPGCNNFRHHLAWHLALFHLERGETDAVLELYDRDVMPAASDDFRDMANAVSLLWRLRQWGIDTGSRWEQLREVALKRHQDMTLVFASLHNLLVLIATGEREASAKLIDRLATLAADQDSEQGKVAREVGLGLAELIAANEAATIASSARIAPRLIQVGGSNAQRDLFMRILLLAASENGSKAALSHLTHLRSAIRNEDRFALRIASSRTIHLERGAA